ncbi:MAG: GNAT family N-acetyltransferase [Bacteroides sp.]|nr:GNAT family N-acetyltransferase [Ruminococcus flavefaciens]MCM1555088.1 GNAT family N-acetyltransferase [Bacteroides sp.]MCM1555461.1 GNAT family N-acetyltransferase [Bacteroides sp.]
MQAIIPPVERHFIEQELTQDKFLRYTNFGDRMVYVVTAHDSPHIMQEIGRLREEAFRQGGGGTGKETDIDEFDTMPDPYKQLLVWDPQDKEIVGGYRFIEGNRVKFDAQGNPLLSTTEIFTFSDKFIKEYLPKTIELGRSFVQLKYQSSRNGVFSLDNLWDGLGGLVTSNEDWMEYFFGKVTMYTNFNKEARDTLLYYVSVYHKDPDRLVIPINPIQRVTSLEKLQKLFDGLSLEEAYKVTAKRVRELDKNIPPLFNSYIKLSPKMRSFGTCINTHFGGVEETGILIKMDEIYPSKKERHVPQTIEEVRTPKHKTL